MVYEMFLLVAGGAVNICRCTGKTIRDKRVNFF